MKSFFIKISFLTHIHTFDFISAFLQCNAISLLKHAEGLFGIGWLTKCQNNFYINFRSPPTVLPPTTMPWLLIDDDFENVDVNVTKSCGAAKASNDGSVPTTNDAFDDDADEFLLLASEPFL